MRQKFYLILAAMMAALLVYPAHAGMSIHSGQMYSAEVGGVQRMFAVTNIGPAEFGMTWNSHASGEITYHTTFETELSRSENQSEYTFKKSVTDISLGGHPWVRITSTIPGAGDLEVLNGGYGGVSDATGAGVNL